MSLHSDSEGTFAENRLREISDEIVQLRQFADVEPANTLLVNLLEEERRTILKHYIKAVEAEPRNGAEHL